VNESADIHPGENLELLRRAFDEGMVDEIYVSREEVESYARLSVDETLAKTRERERGLVDDAVATTKWWAEARMPAEPKKNAAKVGPNDRCPCGSGKKFEKCCWLKSLAR
jgi:preprotein translocase subunit SecA